MAGITINSGRMEFSNKSTNSADEGSAFKILVLADYGSEQQHKPLAARKPKRIDKDNFEEVFENMSVRLALPALGADIRFLDYDDLQPDFLYDRLSLFSDYRVLKRKLKITKSYAEALQLIQQSPVEVGVEASLEDSKITATTNQDESKTQEFKLDDLLSTSDRAIAQQKPVDDVDQLIKSIVAPYVEEKADGRIEDLIEAVDQAVNQTMRSIMHSSGFQAIESAWRSLDFLNRRLDTDRDCKLFILDINHGELLADLAQSDSILKQLIVDESQTKGAAKFDAVVFGFDLKAQAEQINAFAQLAEACNESGSLLLSSASLDLAGYESSEDIEEARTRELDSEVQSAWSALKSSNTANNIFCVAPNFLLRLPYGKFSSQTHEFEFEELPNPESHDYYLLGSSAYLLVFLMAQAHAGRSSNTVERLPMFVTKVDGEEWIKPSGEYLLTDRQAKPLVDAGLTVVRSVKNSDQVIIDPIQSLKA